MTMSTQTPRPAPSSPVSWGVALAAGTLLLIGGGAIIWSGRDAVPDQPEAVTAALPAVDGMATDVVPTYKRQLPAPPSHLPLHSISFETENGARVVKIKVLETGDELVVDAATGRLLEARPSRPTAPPPAGRFAAPFQPVT
jgi:hypothetical protein